MVTVFKFISEFTDFYNNVLSLLDEAYENEKLSKVYSDTVYDSITEFRYEVERTLESRVLSVEKASNMLYDKIKVFVRIAENCAENYNLLNNEESYEAYKFLSSVIDCYNEMCEEVNE